MMAANFTEAVALDPKNIRAVMARRGLHDLSVWWSPDTDSDVNPLDDPEVQAEVRGFMGWLWTYCLQAEELPLTRENTDG